MSRLVSTFLDGFRSDCQHVNYTTFGAVPITTAERIFGESVTSVN